MNGTRPTVSLRPSAILASFTFLLCGALFSKQQAQEIQNPLHDSSAANLSQRLAAAMDARKSGDPVAIGGASEKVLALALAEMARLRLDAKAYEDAVQLGEQSLQFEDREETHVEIALASLYAGKPSESAKHASAAVALDPQNALAWAIKGEALLETKDYPQAAEAFGRSLELKRDAQSVYALGTAQLGMGEKEKAAETFGTFLAQVGDSGWSRVLVGRAYQGQGSWHEAENEFQRAIALDPATPHANYFWAIAILQGNGWNPTPEVRAHLLAELKLNPRHFEANYMLGSLASTERKDSESDRYLLKASEIKPSVPETWVLLGLNAQRRKDDQAATAYFRKAIERAKNLDPKQHFELRKAYFGLGRLLIASGKTREGEELLAKAKELQVVMLTENRKEFAGAKEEGGMQGEPLYAPDSDSNQRPSASLWSPKAATAEENSPHPRPGLQAKEEADLATILGASFNDLATAEALEQKYQRAFDHYREAGRWGPQIPGLQRNLGLAAYFAGQPGEAIRLLSKLVAETPSDAHARAVLGLAYFGLKNFPQTVKTLKPMADSTGQDPELRYAWAKSLAETGSHAEAIKALQGLEQGEARLSAEQLLEFGQLCRQLGQTERATEFFRRALRLEPDNAAAKCALQLEECR